MTRIPTTADPARSRPRVSRVLLLALALVAALWAATWFRAEARVRRATARVVRLAEKTGEESPVALGLAANRLGGWLATNAVLEVADSGEWAADRQEIVRLFVQVRNSFETVVFENPRIATTVPRRGEIRAEVSAHYRLVAAGVPVAEGDGHAALRWIKGPDGWTIARASLQPDPREKNSWSRP